MFNFIKNAMKFVIKTIANIIMLPFSYFRNETQVPAPAPVYHSSSSVKVLKISKPERRILEPVVVREVIGGELYNPGINGFVLPGSEQIKLTTISPDIKQQERYDKEYEEALASYYAKVKPESGRFSMKKVKF